MKNVKVYQSNAITQARYSYTVIEKRCIYLVLKEINTRIESNSQLFEHGYTEQKITLKSSDLVKAADRKDAYAALRSLRKKDIEIETDGYWINCGFISSAKHNKGEDSYEVTICSEVLPFILELSKCYTEYNLTIAISLKSIYSQRFYELCNQYKNMKSRSFFLTVDRLREILCLGNKYPMVADFKKKVLDVAQKELKSLYEKGHADLCFKYSVHQKEGKKIKSFKFDIIMVDQEETRITDIDQAVKKISSILNAFFKRDKKYIKRAIQSIQFNPDKAIEIAEKLNNKVLDYDKDSIPPIIRYVLKADYGIE